MSMSSRFTGVVTAILFLAFAFWAFSGAAQDFDPSNCEQSCQAAQDACSQSCADHDDPVECDSDCRDRYEDCMDSCR